MTAAPGECRICQPYRRTPVLARALRQSDLGSGEADHDRLGLVRVGLILVLAAGSQVLASRLGSRH